MPGRGRREGRRFKNFENLGGDTDDQDTLIRLIEEATGTLKRPGALRRTPPTSIRSRSQPTVRESRKIVEEEDYEYTEAPPSTAGGADRRDPVTPSVRYPTILRPVRHGLFEPAKEAGGAIKSGSASTKLSI